MVELAVVCWPSMGGGQPPAGASTGGGQEVCSFDTGCALADSDMLKGLGQVGGQAVCATEELQLQALDAALPPSILLLRPLQELLFDVPHIAECEAKYFLPCRPKRCCRTCLVLPCCPLQQQLRRWPLIACQTGRGTTPCSWRCFHVLIVCCLVSGSQEHSNHMPGARLTMSHGLRWEWRAAESNQRQQDLGDTQGHR